MPVCWPPPKLPMSRRTTGVSAVHLARRFKDPAGAILRRRGIGQSDLVRAIRVHDVEIEVDGGVRRKKPATAE